MSYRKSNFGYPEPRGAANALVNPDVPKANKTVLARQAPLRKQQGQASTFAPERHGNRVVAFTTGEDYFKDVCAAIRGAKQSVFIAGWQVNWAVRLAGNVRLIDALKGAVANGAKVYVMPWQSPKVGVNTGDLGTMLAVFQLNCGREGLRAFCCPAGLQNDFSGIEETFFSHHQKMVLVDGEIAYVGGIDLAFGRRDDARFQLAHGWRTGPEVYNTCVPARHKLAPAEAALYVDESELLRATLAVGPMKSLLNAETDATDTAADSVLGRGVDAAVNWWRTPIDIDNLPRYLRQLVRWAQSAAQAAGLVVDRASEPARRAFDAAQQRSADALIAKLDEGLVSASEITEVSALARTAIRMTYNTLLGISWLNEAPYGELFNAGAQSTPGGSATYDADQPRMPWQDVQVRIEGPSVYDLAQNFIRRWNSVQKSYLLGPLEARTRIGVDLYPPKPADGKGNGGTGGVAVRVLRSAALTLQRDEAKATPGLPQPQAEQHEIHDAMVSAILNAERFLYIENQFFQGAFGTPSAQENDHRSRSGPMSYLLSYPGNRISVALTRASATNRGSLPGNFVSRAIADRIERAIQWGQPFHAYIVLPVHPEGSLADLAVVGQIHWTLQRLVYASDSLVNRVRLALYARQNCKEPRNRAQWEEANRKGLAPGMQPGLLAFEEAIRHSSINEYLTLLNLRTCQTVAGKARTEQVYVHTKLLIVDDLIAIVGSANINDRSLAGGRDSELAVLLMDSASQTAPLDGKNPINVRKLAHELRVKLWKKHFALLGSGDGVNPASDLAAVVDKPADPATWRAIQTVAKANAAVYAKAFRWVPRDGASIWPVWDSKRKFSDDPRTEQNEAAPVARIRSEVEPFEAKMPFSEGFWKSPPAASMPAGIKGFICALPMLWAQGENNHPDMNMILLTRTDPPVAEPPPQQALTSPASGAASETAA